MLLCELKTLGAAVRVAVYSAPGVLILVLAGLKLEHLAAVVCR